MIALSSTQYRNTPFIDNKDSESARKAIIKALKDKDKLRDLLV